MPSAWTMEELGRILDEARKQKTPKTGMLYPPGLFFTALILTAYDTGLRLGSLLGIERAGWKPERLEISVEAEATKAGVAQSFRVSEQTRDAITTMLAAAKSGETPTRLYPWPVRHDGIFEAYRGILKRAGLYVKGKNNLFHKLRRTAASHLTAAIGIEGACRQLGHSSVEMTRRYVDPRMTSGHSAAEHLPRPIHEGPPSM